MGSWRASYDNNYLFPFCFERSALLKVVKGGFIKSRSARYMLLGAPVSSSFYFTFYECSI